MSPVQHRTGVLAIDEGTTGTRAGIVREDGTVGDVGDPGAVGWAISRAGRGNWPSPA